MHSQITNGEQLLGLVRKAFEELDDPSVPLSNTVAKCMRIARLSDDWLNFVWLEMEQRGPGEFRSRSGEVEAAEFVGRQKAEHFKTIAGRVYIQERGTLSDSDKILGMGVGEIEHSIIALKGLLDDTGAGPSARGELVIGISDREMMLSKIRHNVARFLGQAEKDLFAGGMARSSFDRVQSFVADWLEQNAPAVAVKLASAYEQVHRGDPEALSHSLTSCRRAIKAFADIVQPATDEPAIGLDGNMHDLSDDKPHNRILFRVSKAAGSSKRVSLLRAEVESLSKRIDKHNELASKGVHSEVSLGEADHCIVETNLILAACIELIGRETAMSEA